MEGREEWKTRGNGEGAKGLKFDQGRVAHVCHPSLDDLEKGKGGKATNFNQGRVVHVCHPSLGDLGLGPLPQPRPGRQMHIGSWIISGVHLYHL